MPNRQCGKDEREQLAPRLQSPPLSAKWCAVALSCRKSTRIIFLFGGTLWIRWFYLFNLHPYRSELTICTSLQEASQIRTSDLSLVSLVDVVAVRQLRDLQPMARKSSQFHIETKRKGHHCHTELHTRKRKCLQIRVTVKIYTKTTDILNYMWIRIAGLNNKQYANICEKFCQSTEVFSLQR